MADLSPPDGGVPTWLVAAGSIAATILSWRVWGPVGAWIAKRLDLQQQMSATERTDYIQQLIAERKADREEMLELRKDLAEETELRMAMVVENAELRKDVDHLKRNAAEDKRECQRAIRRLQDQIAQLQKDKQS